MNQKFIRHIPKQISVSIQVKPGSKKGPLLEAGGKDFVAYVRERAQEGKANNATAALIAKDFSVGKSRVQLV
ncbi:DUF167 domain-containing protein [Candidatus Nomurabacteria bacterium]|nr:DUF167 domain-containing protein [Candidatus Nomurabacteria bacterium]